MPRLTARLGPLGLGVLCASCGGASDHASPGPVTATVRAVAVTPDTVVVLEGQQTTAAATPRDASGATVGGRSVVWAVQDTTVASVGASGVVTARRAGRTTLSATVDGVSGSAAVLVTPIPVATIAISLPAPTLVAGQSEQATVVTRDGSGAALTGRAVSYASSDTTVATVNTTGYVTAVAPGTVVLTATSETRAGTVALSVVPVPVASVTLALASSALVVGQTTQASATARDGAGNTLAGRTITYATSDAGVATISAGGSVAAVSPGTATLSATAEGRSGTATVTVTSDPVTTVALVLDTPFLAPGHSTGSTVTLNDANGTVLRNRTVTYATSDATVATVGSTGVVQALAEGAATITASSEGKTGSATVTVDKTAPTIADVTLAPTTVDVTSAAASVTVSLHVTDAGSGVRSASINLQSPFGSTQLIIQGCSLALASGTRNDGIWQCVIPFAQGVPAGTWSLTASVSDQAANRRDYQTSDLSAAGLPSTVTVQSN